MNELTRLDLKMSNCCAIKGVESVTRSLPSWVETWQEWPQYPHAQHIETLGSQALWGL